MSKAGTSSATVDKIGKKRKSSTATKSVTAGKSGSTAGKSRSTAGKSEAAKKSGRGGKTAGGKSAGASGSGSAFGAALMAGSSKQKKKKAAAIAKKVGKRAAFKKRGRNVESKMPILKNFMNNHKNVNNYLYYEGYIGSGFTVQMSRYLKNGKCYLSIRRPGITGIVLDCDFFANLRESIKEIEEGFGEEIGLGSETPADEVDLMEG